jgi:hypothetical protein
MVFLVTEWFLLRSGRYYLKPVLRILSLSQVQNCTLAASLNYTFFYLPLIFAFFSTSRNNLLRRLQTLEGDNC